MPALFFRFRQPHNLRGDFDALPGAGQLKANAWEVVTYDKGVGCGNGHARLTYVEDPLPKARTPRVEK